MGVINHFIDRAKEPKFVSPRKHLGRFGTRSDDFKTYFKEGYYWHYDRYKTRYQYKKKLIKKLKYIIRDVMAYVQYFDHPYYGKDNKPLSYFEVFKAQLDSLDYCMNNFGKTFGIDYFDNKNFSRLRVALTLCILFRELHWINSRYRVMGYYYSDRKKPKKHEEIDLLLPQKKGHLFNRDMVYPNMKNGVCMRIEDRENFTTNSSFNMFVFNGLVPKELLQDIDNYKHDVFGELLATIGGNRDTKLYHQLKEVDKYSQLKWLGYDGDSSFVFNPSDARLYDEVYGNTENYVRHYCGDSVFKSNIIVEIEEPEDDDQDMDLEMSVDDCDTVTVNKSENNSVAVSELKGKVSLKWVISNNDTFKKFEDYLIKLVEIKEIKDAVYFDEVESVIYVRFKEFRFFSQDKINSDVEKSLLKLSTCTLGRCVFYDEDKSSSWYFKLKAEFFKSFFKEWAKSYEKCRAEIINFEVEEKEKL